ncbi:MarR family transcriptional regulator [Pseudophaeobacter sp.]|uniref:MarR family winged helix-turn-helix transcriptional regulator n=1 Tax=Pseudophaeobacter sp. TaxID=1971739 RepID=UPI00329A5C93
MPKSAARSAPHEGSTPELQALLGVLALYWRMEEAFGQQDFTGGLGKAECYLLMQLDCPRRMGELAKMLLMVPSSVTSAADRLEQEGLALRERDVDDRRAFQLKLTSKGRSLRDTLEMRAGRAFRDICGLNEDEIQQFALLSGKIQEKILGSAAQRPDKES